MANLNVSDIQATRKVANVIEQSTSRKGQQGTASEKEKKERADSMRTQGRKGCKAVRINMAFTPENHEFIKVMSAATGRTMANFTNLIIAAYQREHPEMMKDAHKFLKTVNSGAFTALLDPDGAENAEEES